MKLLVSFGISIAILAWGSIVSAQTTQPTTSEYKQDVPSVPINGIDVPLSVLMYAQMEYQGYAVTKAQKTTLNNAEVIRLLADRDDVSSGYDGKYLFFDRTWKLLEYKEIVPPGPVQKQDKKQEDANPEKKEPEKVDKPKPVEEKEDKPVVEKPERPEDETPPPQDQPTKPEEQATPTGQ